MEKESDNLKKNLEQGKVESGDCPLCYEQYNNGTTIFSILCGHVFHLTCFMDSFNKYRSRCLLCRQFASLDQVRMVFFINKEKKMAT